MTAARTWPAAQRRVLSLVRRHTEDRAADPPRRSEEENGSALPAGIPSLVIRLFMLIWLGFLALPILSVARAYPGSIRLAAAIAGCTIFAAVYAAIIMLHRFDGTQPGWMRVRIALAALLAALAIVLVLVFGADWLELFIFVGCVAALALPFPAAPWAVGGIAVIAGVISQLVNAGWMGTLVAVLPAGGLGLGMIGAIYLFASIRELHIARRTAARLAVAEERLRIARDLHDLLGHSLSLIALKTDLAGRLAASDPSAAAQEIHDAERVAREALHEVREAVAGYRQPMLHMELEDARDMLETAGIACELADMASSLPTIADAVLAWAVREGATNVLRHSRAKHCAISVIRVGETVRCEIRDDGCGPSEGVTAAGATCGGSGLAGLAERVTTAGGALDIGPAHEWGSGFSLRIELPVGGERVGVRAMPPSEADRGSETDDSRAAG